MDQSEEQKTVAAVLGVDQATLIRVAEPATLTSDDLLTLPSVEGFVGPDWFNLDVGGELRAAARYEADDMSLVVVKHEMEIVFWAVDALAGAGVSYVTSKLLDHVLAHRRSRAPRPVAAPEVFAGLNGEMLVGEHHQRHAHLLSVLFRTNSPPTQEWLRNTVMGSLHDCDGVLVATIISHTAISPSVVRSLADVAEARGMRLRLDFPRHADEAIS